MVDAERLNTSVIFSTLLSHSFKNMFFFFMGGGWAGGGGQWGGGRGGAVGGGGRAIKTENSA